MTPLEKKMLQHSYNGLSGTLAIARSGFRQVQNHPMATRQSRELAESLEHQLHQLMDSLRAKNPLRAPCQHIADYYQKKWEEGPNIGNNILRHGYSQWAAGLPDLPHNNLYGED